MALPQGPFADEPPEARIDNVEIYIDPDGSVVFADLPRELMFLYESLQQPSPDAASGAAPAADDPDTGASSQAA